MPWLRLGPIQRQLSPSGDSTLITSAPMSPRICVANGPSTTVVRSITRMPASGPPCIYVSLHTMSQVCARCARIGKTWHCAPLPPAGEVLYVWCMPTIILTGDVNLMNVDDPAVPFARVQDEFRATDIVFSNLECCLYDPPHGHAAENEGFFASPQVGGEALRHAGIAAVGIANNVNYGDAAITASVARLDALGIPHTGAGANAAAARAPVILERNGIRYGFLQRSSVYWPTNHEAG